MHRSKKILKWVAVLLLWLAIWQLISWVVGQEILIPAPVVAFSALIEFIKTPKFWGSVFWSMFRIICGYLLGIAVGIVGAILSTRFSIFKAVVTPLLLLIKSVPVASFIILALVWIKSGSLPIFISFLMVLPMIWGSVESGINNLDKSYIELAEVYKLKPLKVLFEIKIPMILPSFISTSMIALGFAWKSGIAAEVICRPINSLGGMLQDSKLYLDTPQIFALTVVVALLSMILEWIIKRCVRRFTDDKH